MTLYEQKFRDILAEILQLDQAELDFGIYRIMNQKRKDIEAFLNNRLVPEITKILKTQTSARTDISAMENEVFSHLAKFFSRYYEVAILSLNVAIRTMPMPFLIAERK